MIPGNENKETVEGAGGSDSEHREDDSTQAADTPDASEPGEPDSPRDEAAAAPQPANDAEAEESATAQVADLQDKLLRAVAETENLRRRAERDVADARKYGAVNLARDLLSVADNLRRALDSVPAGARERDPALDSLIAGVELTERDLAGAFERNGVRRIEPLGEKLDPNRHQAMMQVPDESEPGTIVKVVQSGYLLHDRLLRAAMVGVSSGPAPGSDGDRGADRPPGAPVMDTEA